jgi:two-component system sensor histidine kinase DegS
MVFRGQEGRVEKGVIDTFHEEFQSELEHTRRELREIELTIEHSQSEVNKLTQRNALITTKLQQIQAQTETSSKSDIRAAYDVALDAQQRLFVMRGQLDKLTAEQIRITRYAKLIERVLQFIENSKTGVDARQRGHSAMAQTVEMIIQAQESERQRLARQMHDGPAQALANFILQTEIAMRLFDIDQSKAREELTSVKSAATSTFQKVRDFIFELRPMMLDDLGLAPTLNRYIETTKEQTGIDLRLTTIGLEQRLEPYLEVLMFRAIQELCGNSIRHGQATQIRIQIDGNDNQVRVSVEDNGKGFDIEAVKNQGGMGMKIIRDRVEMLGGEMEIHSNIGQGSHILFRVPASRTGVFA